MHVRIPASINRQLRARDLAENSDGIGSAHKLLQDVLSKELLDLPVTGHWLRNARLRIAIPIMISTVADQAASGLFQCPDQVAPLHPIDSSASRRMPGISPLVRSR